jgi:hypothetical protein
MDDVAVSNSNTSSYSNLPNLQIIRRNGAVVAFNPEKISIALSKHSWPSRATVR